MEQGEVVTLQDQVCTTSASSIYGETPSVVSATLLYEMEASGVLYPVSEVDLFCLHYVFLPQLNSQIVRFIEGWNNHPLCKG